MKQYLFPVSLAAIFMIGAFLLPETAFMQNDLLGLGYGQASGLGGSDLRFTAARIIRSALSLLGLGAVAFIIYGGFLMMTSGGSQDRVSQGRSVLLYAVIGLIIILSAWTISTFVLRNAYQATTGQATTQGLRVR